MSGLQLKLSATLEVQHHAQARFQLLKPSVIFLKLAYAIVSGGHHGATMQGRQCRGLPTVDH